MVQVSAAAAARLQGLIEQRGIALETLAAETEVPPSTLERLVSRQLTWIDEAILRRIARRLDHYPGWILDGSLRRGEVIGQRLCELMRAHAPALDVPDLFREMDARQPGCVTQRQLYRIYHGEIDRPRSETLAVAAAVLGSTLEHLRNGSDAGPAKVATGSTSGMPPLIALPREVPRTPHRPKALIWITVLVAVVAAVYLVFPGSPPRPGISIHIVDGQSAVEGRDGSGRVVWRYPGSSEIQFIHHLFWEGRELVLVAFDHLINRDDTPFVVLERSSGEVVLRDVPLEQTGHEIAAVLGPSHNDWAFRLAHFDIAAAPPPLANVWGDAEKELVVVLEAVGSGPAIVRAFTPRGERVVNYTMAGGITCMLFNDVDHDGRSEILIGGPSVSSRYDLVAVLLDSRHCTGASPDAVELPFCSTADSSRASLLLPGFGDRYMQLLRTRRLRPWYCSADEHGFLLEVGSEPNVPVMVSLDTSLTVLSAVPADIFRTGMRTWSDADSAAFETEELGSWVSTAVNPRAATLARP